MLVFWLEGPKVIGTDSHIHFQTHPSCLMTLPTVTCFQQARRSQHKRKCEGQKPINGMIMLKKKKERGWSEITEEVQRKT